jgi:hypothetical protein
MTSEFIRVQSGTIDCREGGGAACPVAERGGGRYNDRDRQSAVQAVHTVPGWVVCALQLSCSIALQQNFQIKIERAVHLTL